MQTWQFESGGMNNIAPQTEDQSFQVEQTFQKSQKILNFLAIYRSVESNNRIEIRKTYTDVIPCSVASRTRS
jgi:hypothetical protein